METLSHRRQTQPIDENHFEACERLPEGGQEAQTGIDGEGIAAIRHRYFGKRYFAASGDRCEPGDVEEIRCADCNGCMPQSDERREADVRPDSCGCFGSIQRQFRKVEAVQRSEETAVSSGAAQSKSDDYDNRRKSSRRDCRYNRSKEITAEEIFYCSYRNTLHLAPPMRDAGFDCMMKRMRIRLDINFV